jgi:hypothetical protein
MSGNENFFIGENLNYHIGINRRGFEKVYEIMNKMNIINKEKKY